MPEPRVAFHDIPADAFPFTIELFRRDTGEVLWTTTVTGPRAIAVPGLGNERYSVWSRIKWSDGTVDEKGPPGDE